MFTKPYNFLLALFFMSAVIYQSFGQSTETEFRMTTDPNTGLLTVAPQLKVKSRKLNLSYDEAKSYYNSAYGNPYLYDATPRACDLLLNDGDTVYNVSVVVDAFQDELIAIVDGEEQIMQVQAIKRIIPRNGSFEYPLERRLPTSTKKFCELLYERDVTVVRVTTVNMRTEGGSVPGLEKERKRFIRLDEYFLQQTDVHWNKITFSKTDELLDQLPLEERQRWEHAMKRRGMKKIKKPKHLMAILEFLEAEPK